MNTEKDHLDADEILDAAELETLDDAKRFAKAWIMTAAQHARNEDYYHGRYEKLRAAMRDANEILGQVFEGDDEGGGALRDAVLVGKAQKILDAAAVVSAPPAAHVAGQWVAGSLADHERLCLLLIEAEGLKPLPDNAIIAVLCDSVRLVRETVRRRGSR